MKKFSDPLHMFEHTLAESPPNLREQKEELSRELAESQKEVHHG
jgi:hypothetical protein